MSKKRFTMCYEQNDINGWTMSIVDWETKEPFNYTTYEVHSSSITDTKDEMEDLCLLLNELHEENQLLHKLNEDAMEFIEDNFDLNITFSDRELNNICNEMGWELSEKRIRNNQLEKENEKLKIFLKAVNEELSLANRDCDILEEENEQLKQQKDKWKQQCIHFKGMLDDMDIAYLCDEWIYGELKGNLE